jgi:hypothetical protein
MREGMTAPRNDDALLFAFYSTTITHLMMRDEFVYTQTNTRLPPSPLIGASLKAVIANEALAGAGA